MARQGSSTKSGMTLPSSARQRLGRVAVSSRLSDARIDDAGQPAFRGQLSGGVSSEAIFLPEPGFGFQLAVGLVFLATVGCGRSTSNIPGLT